MKALCPSDYELEALLLDQDGGRADHVVQCESCSTRLARMKTDGAVFEQRILPRIQSRLPKAAPRRTPWWSWGLGLIPAAAVVAFVVHSSVPSELAKPTVHTKGDTCALSVLLDNKGMTTQVESDGIVPADATLRFDAHFSSPKWVLVLSADETGEVSQLYPPTGDAVRVEKPDMLPGGALLDGKRGPERMFVFCGTQSMSASEVESAVRHSVAPGRARDVERIEGLPSGVTQGTVLLEKVP